MLAAARTFLTRSGRCAHRRPPFKKFQFHGWTRTTSHAPLAAPLPGGGGRWHAQRTLCAGSLMHWVPGPALVLPS